jgi:hypothetical protein
MSASELWHWELRGAAGSEKQQDDNFERECGMRREASAQPAVRDGRDGRPRQLEMNRWRIYRLVHTGRRGTSKGGHGGSGGRVVFTATESCQREEAAVRSARRWLSVRMACSSSSIEGGAIFFFQDPRCYSTVGKSTRGREYEAWTHQSACSDGPPPPPFQLVFL